MRIFTWPGNIHGYFKFVRGLALSVPRSEQLYEINAVSIEKQLTFARTYIRLYLKSRIKGTIIQYVSPGVVIRRENVRFVHLCPPRICLRWGHNGNYFGKLFGMFSLAKTFS